MNYDADVVPGAGMQKIRGCSVSPALFDSWSQSFVYRRAPFYLETSDLAALPPELPVMSRAEAARDWADLPLGARDIYTVYKVRPSAVWVLILDSASLLSLEEAVRNDLLHRQWMAGRGQIYPLQFYEEMTQRVAVADEADPFVFSTEDGPMLSLQHEVWHGLGPETRSRWLTWYVSQEDTTCHSSAFTEDAWQAIDRVCGPMTKRLAGTFSPRSGPNCFSTALAAASRNPALGTSVADLWLNQEPFFRGLEGRGFRACGSVKDLEEVAAGSVLVWSTAAEEVRHACFVPLEGWALNKDAQGWHAPRQLLPLAGLVESWKDETPLMQLYRPE